MLHFISLALGVGLSAACGLRVFLPFLAASLAARSGHLSFSPGFEWLASDGALVALATATALEVLAYWVPWLDHLLDALATPAAVVAGVLASAAVWVQFPPLLRWGAALILGGGAAGAVQAGTVLLRLKSALLTGGAGNPVVALVELAAALVLSAIALFVPVLALAALAAFGLLTWRVARRRAARA